jgi:predicted alpha/beta-fold hydrolase
MASWLGYSSVRFTHSPDSVVIKQKDKTETTLAELCKTTTPPCKLNPLLFNGHLQTIWTALINDADIPIYYKRRVFEAEDPAYAGQFAVDFAVKPYDAERDESLPNRTAHYTEAEFETLGSDDTTPMIVCLHGLSGGSYEIYLRAVLKPLIDAGWGACVVNARGCAMSKITTGVLFNARATWDVRQMVKWIRKKWPNRKLYGIGFSLGANILTNVRSLRVPLRRFNLTCV